MVKDGVAKDEVEALVLERQSLGVGLAGLDLEPQALDPGGELAEHPRGDIRRHEPLDRAELHQVEREVPRARADLERVQEGPLGPAAERLGELAADLVLADRAEVDPPLRVVARGGRVVVAGVDVADLVCAERLGRHRHGSVLLRAL